MCLRRDTAPCYESDSEILGMPIYSKKGHRRRERRIHKMRHRAKWAAVLLSALLLAATLMAVRTHRTPGPGGVMPSTLDVKTSYRVR